MSWYLEVLKKYAVFHGRARRREYWMFAMFNFVVSMMLYLLDSAFGLANEEMAMGLLGGIYSLGVFIPGLAVGVRRLHDTGRSGWWLVISWVPIVGGLALLYFFAKEGDSGTNDFGTDPKQRARKRPVATRTRRAA